MITGLFTLLLIAAGFAVYFLPTIAARRKANFGAIFALNLLLGWTLIGWVVALVWAMTVDNPPVHMVGGPPVMPAGSFCNTCGNRNQQGARFCGSCGRSMGALSRGVGA
jgi:hypothetical protein